MAHPLKHAESSVKSWGGTVEDYLPLHEKMDCSKKYFPDNRHRALTHTMFWVYEVMIPLFGAYLKLGNGKLVSVKDICEKHILEDYRMKFIPTPQDWLQEIGMKNWMQNGFGANRMTDPGDLPQSSWLKKSLEDQANQDSPDLTKDLAYKD